MPEGLLMYGGGMGELGPARRQVQLLASIFHPGTPNDVAPPPFNLPDSAARAPDQPDRAGVPAARVPLGLTAGIPMRHEMGRGGSAHDCGCPERLRR